MGKSYERISKGEGAEIMFSDISMPLFMKNSEWYYFDDEAGITCLTEAGNKIPEVVASYNVYYSDEDSDLSY